MNSLDLDISQEADPPSVAAAPWVGRNDPCVFGSGELIVWGDVASQVRGCLRHAPRVTGRNATRGAATSPGGAGPLLPDRTPADRRQRLNMGE